MKKMIGLLVVLLGMGTSVRAAELVVTQDSITIEGGTYDMIDLTGRKYVTLRNVTVRNTTGENYYAAVKMAGSKYITMENCEVDGGAEAVRGNGSCGGIKLDGASRVTIRGCKIHNLNDDGIRLYTATIVDIIGNEIYNLRSCGTDPEPDCANCNNGHSDGIQIIDCIRINVIGNLIRNDHSGTSGIFMGNSGINCKDVTIANNIINTPQCYYTTYIWYQERFKMYNNVIWGYRSGGASIWYGINMWDFELVNNVVKYIKFKNGGSYNGSEHTISNNCFATAFNYGSGNLQGADPGFASVSKTATPTNVNANMFKLKSGSACINKGLSNSNTPVTDYLGLGRNGAPDIGAFEYGGIDIGTGEAGFTASPRSGVAPLRVTFTNTSTGTWTGWQWNFGDGGSSTLQNPTRTYQNPGTYTVSLTASGAQGDDTHTATNYITVTDQPVDPVQIVVEAEDMSLDGYTVDNIKLSGEGIMIANTTTVPTTAEATWTFTGQSGVWDLDATVVTENDGNPNLKVYVGSTKVLDEDYPLGSHTVTDRVDLSATGISINKGDVIKIVGTSDYLTSAAAAAFARVDKLTFDLVSSSVEDQFLLWNRPDAPVEVEVFPSPMHGKLSLESADFLLSDIKLSLHDQTGRVVRTHQGVGDRRVYEWDVQDLTPGVYWYRAEMNGSEITGKVVKIK